MDTNFHGNNIKELDDGTIEISTKNGHTFRLNPDGSFDGDIPNMPRISVDDIAELEAYKIEKKDGFTTHKLQLEGGGAATIVFDDSGKITDLQTHNAGTKIGEDGAIKICKNKEPPPDIFP